MPEITLTAAEKRTITGMKRSVLSIGDKLSAVRETAKDLAPRIMRTFNELAAKYEDLGGFVGFARLFDANIPTHAATKDNTPGYRVNKVYMALDYMRRIQATTNRPRGTQGRRDPATDQLARTIATILQVVRDAAPVYAALEREFQLNPRMIARIKSRVEAVRPLIDLSGVRAADIGADAIIHMDRAAAPDDGAAVADHAAAALRRRRGAAPAAAPPEQVRRGPGRPRVNAAA